MKVAGQKIVALISSRSVSKIWLWAVVVGFGVISGCVTTHPPFDEYTVAKAALDAARLVEADRHSPGFWHKAEQSYQKAQGLYNDRHYEEARQEFLRAKANAERAENSARIIRMKTGEVL